MDYDERLEIDCIDDPNSSTPVHSRMSVANESSDFYSPVFSQCTREERENIDVMWDWNSPQSKPRTLKHKKRIDVQQSPKLPIKRHPSNDQIRVFGKLREELEMLRNQIVTEHTETDNERASSSRSIGINGLANLSVVEDIFDDSMEEQLIRCSQEAESTLTKNGNVANEQPLRDTIENPIVKDSIPILETRNAKAVISNSDNYVQHYIPNSYNDNPSNKKEINNIVSKYLNNNENKLADSADDSFDYLLETLNDEDLLQSQVPTQVIVQHTQCHIQYKERNVASCSQEANVAAPAKCTAQEIEQKRREALAKLETKKNQTGSDGESPIKCSPEEIEKKRLQALAKLEAKKKQDVIEQNRQQALKRLQLSKQRRALQAQLSVPPKISNYK